MTPDCEPLRACRACGGTRFVPVLDLGSTPLANRLLTADQLREPEPAYPLRLVFCPACATLQLDQTVSPEVLFREYLYFSSVSPALLRHAEAIADRQALALGLGPQSLVMEAASNDGYLLKNFVARGIPVLGIEPARNIAAAARANGVETRNDFFTAGLADQLASAGSRTDLFLANNVLAHVPDTSEFVRGIATVLKPAGRAVIEVPYAKDMVDHTEFDTIYHEHLCYFSLTALDHLFRRKGLEVVDAERVPIHGGSLRVTAAHAGAAAVTERVRALLAEEQAWGAGRAEFYLGFGQRVEALRAALLDRLRRFKAEGMRVAAYGASAKGSTLLNYFGIGRETIEYVVDRSPHKQGRYTPGTHLPIFPPERLVEDRPDYVLLLTWNFADEIFQQQQAYRDGGGRFIVPIPTVTVV